MKLEEPVGEENINEPGGMEKFVWAAMQISTLHHLSSCMGKKLVHHGSRSRPILVALDLMAAKKQVMSNRFKVASGICEVQADGFVIFEMIISYEKRVLTLC